MASLGLKISIHIQKLIRIQQGSTEGREAVIRYEFDRCDRFLVARFTLEGELKSSADIGCRGLISFFFYPICKVTGLLKKERAVEKVQCL